MTESVTWIPRRVREVLTQGAVGVLVVAMVQGVTEFLLLSLGFVVFVMVVYDSYNSGYEEAREEREVEKENMERLAYRFRQRADHPKTAPAEAKAFVQAADEVDAVADGDEIREEIE